MENLEQIIEAVIFTSGKGITKNSIKEKLVDVDDKDFDEAILALKTKYSGKSGVKLITYNGKLQFASNPEYGNIVSEILTKIKEKELTKTLLEVLAIIAYKQPVTRLDIEELRGVSSEYAVAILQKQELIEACGTKDAVGRPTLFRTTDEFLKRFSLEEIGDLPHFEEILEKIKAIDINYNKTSESLYRDIKSEEINEEEILQAVKRKEDTQFEDEIAASEMPEFLSGEEFSVME